MQFNRFTLAVAAALPLLAACQRDKGPFTDPLPPLGYVRLVHGVPNAGALDMRFTDAVAFSPFEIGIAYRGIGRYQETATGTRRLRVFFRSSQIDSASTILGDTAIAVSPNTYYTVVFTGRIGAGNTPAAAFRIYTDTQPAPAAGQFSIRATHLGVGVGGVDVYGDTVGAPLAASPTVANVQFGARSTYLTRATGTFAFRVFAAGTTTPALATATAPAGTAGTSTSNPVAGTTVGGSGLSAFVFAPGDAGSPNAAVTAPSIIFAMDKRPANTFQ